MAATHSGTLIPEDEPVRIRRSFSENRSRARRGDQFLDDFEIDRSHDHHRPPAAVQGITDLDPSLLGMTMRSRVENRRFCCLMDHRIDRKLGHQTFLSSARQKCPSDDTLLAAANGLRPRQRRLELVRVARDCKCFWRTTHRSWKRMIFHQPNRSQSAVLAICGFWAPTGFSAAMHCIPATWSSCSTDLRPIWCSRTLPTTSTGR